MKKHFIDLIRYNDWANRRVLITLEEHEIDDQDILQLFSHVLSAQIIWLNRIKGIPTTPFPLWETYKLRELRSMTEESSRNWLNLVETHPNQTFEEMIDYKNTEGKKFENTLRKIIMHVINHSTYHRGQIATKLRGMDIEPPVTDFIAYVRQ
ncbi:MAG: DinB family protein [Fulvivirga sp.]|nr:DinB family protein [Fulvivirga sp.]